MRCSLSVYQIQFFTEPARSQGLRAKHHFLTLVSAGLERGHFAGHDFDQPNPFLAVTFAEEPLAYVFNSERRNWIISFLSPDIRPGRLPQRMEIRYGDAWISVPRLAFLLPVDVLRFEEDFRGLEQAFSKPTPAHLFCVEAGMLNLFRYLAEQSPARHPADVAHALKTQLEDLSLIGKRIAELGVEAGYSRDYPGLLFKREFGTSPQAYRNRYRMQLAIELLAEGKKSVQAIATELGFKHLSHFSGQFRRTFGVSPRTMRRVR